MAADLKVVALRNGAPPTTDIVGNLRALADRIESGQLGPYDGVLVIGICSNQCKPVPMMFGQTMLRHTLAGVCMHTASLIVTE